jgi:hypothetical protein
MRTKLNFFFFPCGSKSIQKKRNHYNRIFKENEKLLCKFFFEIFFVSNQEKVHL